MTFPMPTFMPLAGPLTFVAHGGGEAASTSFSITPNSLGAQNGDVIIVMATFEDINNAITSPGIITEVFDQNDSQGNSRTTLGYGTITDASATLTWSYSGSANVGYAYSIWRNVTDVSGGTYVTDNTSTSVGSDSFGITLAGGYTYVIAFCIADGTSDTGEDASFTSGVTAEASAGTGHTLDIYWMVGYNTASSTVGYTTTQFIRRNLNRSYISVK